MKMQSNLRIRDEEEEEGLINISKDDVGSSSDSKTTPAGRHRNKREAYTVRFPCCDMVMRSSAVTSICMPTRRSVAWSCCIFIVVLVCGLLIGTIRSPNAMEQAKGWIREHWGDGIIEDETDGQEDDLESEFVAGYLAATSNMSLDAETGESPSLRYYSDLCEEYRAKNLGKGTPEYELAAADCGWGYDFKNSSARNHYWRVVLYGPSINQVHISGLMGNAGVCPPSPKCRIGRALRMSELQDADVIIMFQSDANELIHKLPQATKKRQYKVLYWREAQMLSPNVQTQKLFDFEMGVHYYSGLLNPNFLRHPVQYLSGAVYPYPPLQFIPLPERAGKFAISIISHCKAGSQRDVYIAHLASSLGPDRIHQYGDCGDRKLPGESINIATKLMSEYKFYLAFENTIEDGYVTEKLFSALNVPVLPVYYGALNVPNVTITPSFIKVADFKSPKELATYLLYLDASDDKYMEYHAWRKNPASFTKDFLDTLQMKVAGPEELKAYRKRGIKRFPRTAQFCRLCDETYVKYATETRSPNSFVQRFMNPDQINRRFFNGRMLN